MLDGIRGRLYADNTDTIFTQDPATDGLAATWTTSGGGQFAISGQAFVTGQYFLWVDPASLPEGLTVRGGSLLALNMPEDQSLGVPLQRVQSSIGGQVWWEENGDQVRSAGEEGVSAARISLYADDGDGLFNSAQDGLIGSQPTSADGAYEFAGLLAGSYWLVVDDSILPLAGRIGGWVDGSSRRLVSVASAESAGGVDFGAVAGPCAVGGAVWRDLDGDGVREAGEGGLAGATVELFEAGADNEKGAGDDLSFGVCTTGDSGGYSFEHLPAGSYYVQVRVPSGYAFTVYSPSGPDRSRVDCWGQSGLVALDGGSACSDLDAGVVGSSPAFGWAFDVGRYTLANAREMAIDSAGNRYFAGEFRGELDADPGPGQTSLVSQGGTDAFLIKLDSSDNLVWARRYGGSGSDSAQGLCLDDWGNLYVVGSFSTGADFNPGDAEGPLTAEGGLDGFVLKLTADGDYVWAQPLGGASSATAYGVGVDLAGSVYVAGTFSLSGDFDNSGGTCVLTSAGNTDVFAMRLDGSGGFGWAVRVGRSTAETVDSLVVGADVVVAGSFWGTVDFDPGEGVSNLVSAGQNDAYVLALHADGTLDWAGRMGGTGQDYATALAQDSGGDLFVGGSFAGTADFDPGEGVCSLVAPAGTAGYVLRLDGAGAFVWAEGFVGAGATASAGVNDLFASPSGGVYGTGSFTGTIDFDGGAGLLNAVSAGTRDAFVLHLAGEGQTVRLDATGGTASAEGTCLVVDSSGAASFAGPYTGPVDFDPASGQTILDGDSGSMFRATWTAQGNLARVDGLPGSRADSVTTFARGPGGELYLGGLFCGQDDFDPGPAQDLLANYDAASDFFLARYSSAGALAWTGVLSGSGTLALGSASVDGEGSLYLGGSFSGSIDADPGPGVYSLTSAGGLDAVLIKLDASGQLVWARRLGAASDDKICSLVVDSEGFVAAAGEFVGTVNFGDAGGDWLLNSTDGRVFLAKFSSAGGLAWARHYNLPTGQSNVLAAGGAGTLYFASASTSSTPSLIGDKPIARGPFIARIDSSGACVWASTASMSSGSSMPTALCVDSTGNVYATGWLSGTADFDPGAGTCSLTSAGLKDVFVWKLAPDGQLAWAVRAGAASDDVGTGIGVDSAGIVTAVGTFTATADFDPGAGSYVLTNAGSEDGFVLRLDAGGQFLSAWALAGTGNEYVIGSAVAADGNLYVAGYFIQGSLGSSTAVDFDRDPAGSFLLTAKTQGAYLWNVSASDISGRVWDDKSDDGVQDASEQGVSGTAVRLYRDGGDLLFDPGSDDALPATASTDAAGAYWFGELPAGTYWVEAEREQGTLAAGELTSGDDPVRIVLPLANSSGRADFGFFFSGRPIVPDGSFTIPENSPPGTVVGTVVAWDDDVGQTLTYAITGPNAGGAFGIDPATGQITVADNLLLDYEARASILLTVQVTDDDDPPLAALGQITVQLTNVNEAPTLTAVTKLTGAYEDVPFTIPYSTLAQAANETDLDSPVISFIIDSFNGSLTKGGVGVIPGTTGLGPSESLAWTPPLNAHGTLEAFSVRAWDGSLASEVSVPVTVGTSNVADMPVADSAWLTTLEDTPLVASATASDGDGDALIFYLNTTPTHGSVAWQNTGAFVYTPRADYNGTDSFTFRVQANNDYSPVATITITVEPVNDLPVASAPPISTTRNKSVSGSMTGWDADGQNVTLTVLALPAHGTLTWPGGNAFTYVPDLDYIGSDGFTFIATAGGDDSEPCTVPITITEVPPVAVEDGYAAGSAPSLSVLAEGGVLANDENPSGCAMAAELVDGPSHGSLTLNADGSFTYTPQPDYVGLDQFHYLVRSGGVVSGTSAAVRLRVGQLGLLQDGDGEAVSMSLSESVGMGDYVFFVADDGVHGKELWKTDGTTAGTQMVSDIVPGPVSSGPSKFTPVNGTLYFRANGGLWASDGTASGTRLLAQVFPENLIVMNGWLYFSSGTSLWRSNGTAAGTAVVYSGIGFTDWPAFTVVGNTLFFSAYHDTLRWLWKSDGTTPGTMPVKQVGVAEATSLPAVSFNGMLYFAAGELWRSDGTEAGTVQVKEIRLGSSGSSIRDMTVVGDTLYFVADDWVNGEELWKSDGTAEGTSLVKAITPQSSVGPRFLTPLNGRLYFVAVSAAGGSELWTSDGTSDGTFQVKDIQPGTAGYIAGPLLRIGNVLYFAAENASGIELWTSDGTEGGTVLVKDIAPGSASSSPNLFAALNDVLVFTASDGTARSLWKSDGTSGGTVVVKSAGQTVSTLAPTNLTQVGSLLYYTTYPRALKVFDPRTGIAPVSGITTTGAFSDLTPVGADLYFIISDSNGGQTLWRATGQKAVKITGPGGAALTRCSGPVAWNGALYFVATSQSKRLLWRVEGGIAQAAAVLPDLIGNPSNIVIANGTIYLSADGEDGNHWLYRTDLTEDGTTALCRIRVTSTDEIAMVSVGDLVFFGHRAQEGDPLSLWRSDGTVEGTFAVSPAGLYGFNNRTAGNGRLFFTSGSATSEGELWTSDGMPEGTVMVKDIWPGYAGAAPTWLTFVGGRLYFVADDGQHGRELWTSDGSEAGTAMVREINPEGTVPQPCDPTDYQPDPQHLVVVNGRLYFQANDGVNGAEWWTSDGTAEGTVLVGDFNSDGSSYAQSFVGSDGETYLVADDGRHDFQIWRLDYDPPTVVEAAPAQAGGKLAAGSTSISVLFSEQMTGADAADYFELRGLGEDALLGTADDVVVEVAASYSASTTTLSFAPLPAGVYRLTVRAAFSDVAGNLLDGDGDGLSGGDWSLDFVSPPDPGGATVTVVPTGGVWPAAAASADVNGDGLCDLVLSNYGSDTISVLLGNRDGTLSAAGTWASGAHYPNALAIGDLNADSVPDVAVGHMSGDTPIGILLGRGDGTFEPAQMLDTDGALPMGLAIADLNLDGLADLAVVDFGRNQVVVFVGDGTGSFARLDAFPTGGSRPQAVAAGDLNADGKPDLVVANHESSTVAILLGDGTGAFGDAATFGSGGEGPCTVILDDFNHDSLLDVATTDYDSGGVAVLLGCGDGTLQQADTFSSGGFGPCAGATGDFDSDGKLDLAVASYFSNILRIFLGGGDGSFTTLCTVSTGSHPSSVASGDFNADGVTDLAVPCTDNGEVDVVCDVNFPPIVPLVSPGGMLLDVQPAGAMAGQLVQGSDNAFDGLNRLYVNGAIYAPGRPQAGPQDAGRTVPTAEKAMGGLQVHREVTVPSAGSQDFARTIDVFYNPTDGPVTATVRIVGNLGSGSATSVFATSDGDVDLEAADAWFGTDDADGQGCPAIIHAVGGPGGLQPFSVLRTGDNVEWSYSITVQPGQTLRLMYLTILAPTRAQAVAAAQALVVADGLGGEASEFLTREEMLSLANFDLSESATAADDEFSIPEDQELSVDAPGVLANDTRPLGQALTALLVSGPAHAQNFTLHADGSFTYRPAADWNGIDGFTYKAMDAQAGSFGNVTITVLPVNDPPVAVDDSLMASLAEPLTFPASLLKANDSDADGDALTVVAVTPTADTYGTVVLADGQITYTALPGHLAPDSFRYSVSDGQGGLSEATVHVGVVEASRPQVAFTTPNLDVGVAPGAIQSIRITFTEDVFGADDPGCYELKNLGPDELLGTADDVIIPVTVTAGADWAALAFAALAPGIYRLTVSDAILDQYDHRLDGDADGQAGGDWVRDFVESANLLNLVAVPGVGSRSPSDVGAADFNEDGLLDLAVSCLTDQVVLLLGDGHGGFAPARTFDAQGSGPNGIAIGDFNADGHADVATSLYWSNQVSVLLGDGQGGLLPAGVYLTGGTAIERIAAGDFNSDGKPDLVVVNSTSNTISVLFGDGQGAFRTRVTYASGGNAPFEPVMADFNGDGFQDLAVTNSDSSTIEVLLGNGIGGVSTITPYDSGGGRPGALAFGDFDGDGILDLAASNDWTGRVAILRGDGNGGFACTGLLDVTGYVRSLVVADFNGDGLCDLAAGTWDHSNVSLFLNRGQGEFGPVISFSAGGTGIDGMVAADINSDGRIDLMTANRGGRSVGVLMGCWAPAATLTSPNGFVFDVLATASMGLLLAQGTDNAFDGFNRLLVGGEDYAPAVVSLTEDDNGRTLVAGNHTLAGLVVHRELYVPDAGDQDFVRTVDILENLTESAITTTVRIVGNLGSDRATTVFATSDGDLLVEPTDQWFATDDADGTGTPAIVHYLHGPDGLVPFSVSCTDDNLDWVFEVTIEPGQTVRMAQLTILAATRSDVLAAAEALVTTEGFGGMAATGLTVAEQRSVLTFMLRANTSPVPADDAVSCEEDAALGFPASDLLANDTDVDGDPLRVTAVTQTADTHGTVTLLDGQILYTPDADYNGPASFAYSISDGQGGAAGATVAVTVRGVNDPPSAHAGGPYTVGAGQDLVLDASASSEPDAGDSIVLYEWDLNADGSYEYSGAGATVPWSDLSGLAAGVPVPLRLRVTDLSSATATDTTTITVNALSSAAVVDRWVFYNNSAWDGNNASAGASDDAAIAPHTSVLGHGHSDELTRQLGKDALLPGQTASFANYTSYYKGLNGIMVDIDGLANAGGLTAGDFRFKTGNSNTPDSWVDAAAPLSITVRSGAGVGGSDRVTIIWADNDLDGAVEAHEAVAKAWLQVTVLATDNTGLLAVDVFYFGNAVGESGNSATDAVVNATDEIGARAHPHFFLSPAGVYDPYDFNHDKKVDATDQIIARGNQTYFLTALKLITVPGGLGGQSELGMSAPAAPAGSQTQVSLAAYAAVSRILAASSAFEPVLAWPPSETASQAMDRLLGRNSAELGVPELEIS